MNKRCVAVLLLSILFMSTGCHRSSKAQNFNYSQNQAKDEALAKRALTHLAVTCHLYAQENNGMLPDTMLALRPHVTGPYDLHDYILVASGKLREIDDISKEILLRKKVPLPNGRQAVAYVDGRVDTVRVRMASTDDGSLPEMTSTEDGSLPEMTSTEDGSLPKMTSTEDRRPPSASKKPKWHFSLKKPR
jgi:hypothetical protein